MFRLNIQEGLTQIKGVGYFNTSYVSVKLINEGHGEELKEISIHPMFRLNEFL